MPAILVLPDDLLHPRDEPGQLLLRLLILFVPVQLLEVSGELTWGSRHSRRGRNTVMNRLLTSHCLVVTVEQQNIVRK